MKKKLKDLTLSDMVRCCEKYEECSSCPLLELCDGEMGRIIYVWKICSEKEIEVEE